MALRDVRIYGFNGGSRVYGSRDSRADRDLVGLQGVG